MLDARGRIAMEDASPSELLTLDRPGICTEAVTPQTGCWLEKERRMHKI